MATHAGCTLVPAQVMGGSYQRPVWRSGYVVPCTVPAKESFHHCIRIFPGITFPRTESLMAAVSTLNALMAKAAGLIFENGGHGCRKA